MKPVSRRELIRRLRALGFEGPRPGGKHPHMRRGELYISITNPHSKDISIGLLKRILKVAGISETEWDSVK